VGFSGVVTRPISTEDARLFLGWALSAGTEYFQPSTANKGVLAAIDDYLESLPGDARFHCNVMPSGKGLFTLAGASAMAWPLLLIARAGSSTHTLLAVERG
jgi:hypothetical protein